MVTEITNLPLARLNVTVIQNPETGQRIGYKFSWASDEPLFGVSNELLTGAEPGLCNYELPSRFDDGAVTIGRNWFKQEAEYPTLKVFSRDPNGLAAWAVIVTDDGTTFRVALTDGEDGYVVIEDVDTGTVSQGKTEYEAFVNMKEAMTLWLERNE